MFLWVALAATPGVWAQGTCSHVLDGHVYDPENGEPLDLVHVQLLPTDALTFTDPDGRFHLDSLCPGTYTLYLSHLGCEPVEISVEIPSRSHLDIPMPHSKQLLREVEVISRASAEPMGSSLRLDRKGLDLSAGTDLSAALQRQPGVEFIRNGASVAKPLVRGFTGNRLLVLNHGVRLEGQNWGFDHAPETDLAQASRVEVLKGAQGLKYGSGALGGVIVVHGPEIPLQPGWSGRVASSLFSNGWEFGEEGRLAWRPKQLPALSVWAGGNYRNSADRQAPRYNLQNTAYRLFQAEGGVNWDKPHYRLKLYGSSYQTELGLLRAAHTGNLTDLERALEADIPQYTGTPSREVNAPGQSVLHELLAAEGEWHLNRRSRMGLRLARQYNHRRERDVASALNASGTSYEITTYTADAWYALFPASGWNWEGGLNLTSQANTYTGRFFIPNFEQRSAGAYGLVKKAFETWEFEAGFRADYRFLQAYFGSDRGIVDSTNAEAGFSGSVALKKWLHPGRWFQVQLASTWRAPHAYELYSRGLHHGASAIEYGLPGLKPEQEYQLEAEIGAEEDGNRWVATGYLSLVDHFIYLQPRLPAELTIRGAYPAFAFRQDAVVLSGLEGFWEYRLSGRWWQEASADFLYARVAGESRGVPLMPANRLGYGLSYRRQRAGRWEDLSAGMQAQAVMRQWNTDPAADFSPPPPGYLLLNVQSSATLPLSGGRLLAVFNVQNLLNTSYRDYLDRFRYFADQPGINVQLKLIYQFQ